MYKGKPTNQPCSIFRWVAHQHLLFADKWTLLDTFNSEFLQGVFNSKLDFELFLLVTVNKGIDITTMSYCLFWQGRVVADKTKFT